MKHPIWNENLHFLYWQRLKQAFDRRGWHNRLLCRFVHGTWKFGKDLLGNHVIVLEKIKIISKRVFMRPGTWRIKMKPMRLWLLSTLLWAMPAEQVNSVSFNTCILSSATMRAPQARSLSQRSASLRHSHSLTFSLVSAPF